MEPQIVQKLYDTKYRTILSFERYEELLNAGLRLIKENGLKKQCKPNEQSALEVGLDYITEVMLQH